MKPLTSKQEKFAQSFLYEDGKLMWNVKKNGVSKREAGTIHKSGYRYVTFNGKSHVAHRIIYTMLKGDIPNGYEIDHIDRNKDNNAIENLRLVTAQHNCFNRENKGYTYIPRKKSYQVRITVDGKSTNIGYFKTQEEAREAYVTARSKLHIIREVA